jgi:hypothetical protein
MKRKGLFASQKPEALTKCYRPIAISAVAAAARYARLDEKSQSARSKKIKSADTSRGPGGRR